MSTLLSSSFAFLQYYKPTTSFFFFFFFNSINILFFLFVSLCLVNKISTHPVQFQHQTQTYYSRNMKLVWSADLASKAYLDTIKHCKVYEDSSVAELVSAMAAGWNSKLIVETWSQGGALSTTSIGLAIASRHTAGRHVCIVPDQRSGSEYYQAMTKLGMLPEILIGEAEQVMKGLRGIDFLVVDCRDRDYFTKVLRLAKLGTRGAVLVCKHASSMNAVSFRWKTAVEGSLRRVVRSVFLPVGKGLDIAHVAAVGNGGSNVTGANRWIKHVDARSGEEHVIRR